MPKQINTTTLETLNKVARYLHFDDRAKKKINTLGTLAQDTGLMYPTVAKVITDRKFQSVFTRNMLGGLVLSGVIPEFLEEFIDFETPYKPVYQCNDPSHTHNTSSPQKPSSKPQTPKFKTEYYDAPTLRGIIHEDKWTELIGLGYVDPYKAPVSGNKTHIFNQFRNTANVILRTLDLLSAKDPQSKAKEILDDPDKFPPLKSILNKDTAGSNNNTGEIRVLGQTISRDRIKAVIEVCQTKGKQEGYKNPDNDNRTVYYYELAKELEKYV